jgi:hypothetical protein
MAKGGMMEWNDVQCDSYLFFPPPSFFISQHISTSCSTALVPSSPRNPIPAKCMLPEGDGTHGWNRSFFGLHPPSATQGQQQLGYTSRCWSEARTPSPARSPRSRFRWPWRSQSENNNSTPCSTRDLDPCLVHVEKSFTISCRATNEQEENPSTCTPETHPPLRGWESHPSLSCSFEGHRTERSVQSLSTFQGTSPNERGPSDTTSTAWPGFETRPRVEAQSDQTGSSQLEKPTWPLMSSTSLSNMAGSTGVEGRSVNEADNSTTKGDWRSTADCTTPCRTTSAKISLPPIRPVSSFIDLWQHCFSTEVQ